MSTKKLDRHAGTRSQREIREKRSKTMHRAALSPSQKATPEAITAAEEHLNQVSAELRHKQRQAAALNNQTANIEETFKTELTNRDAYIDELNARILDLEELIKEKGIKRKNKDLEKERLYKEINDMLLEKHNL
jgi:hypothetical protein